MPSASLVRKQNGPGAAGRVAGDVRGRVAAERETAPAVAAPSQPFRAGTPEPNGGSRPATTWFTEPHESCEIALWRGYMRAQFYARPTFPEPGDFALEVSPHFRPGRDEIPKKSGGALAAYEALIEKLVRRGWEPSGLGGQWYEQWFRRPVQPGYEPFGPTAPTN